MTNETNAVITLYDRAADGVRVTATQEPLSAEAIEALEAKAAEQAGIVTEGGAVTKKGNVSRNSYVVRGYVNGEKVKEEVVEGGYRLTSPAARAMFKELHAQFSIPKAPKVDKDLKVEITDPVELQKMIDKAQATADKAIARVAKLKEMLANVPAATEATDVEAAEVVEPTEGDMEPTEV